MTTAHDTGQAAHDRAEVLNSIAQSVRDTFQSAESRALSFIREAIVEGLYLPGQRLNLDAIATTLGISRMPVRACLRQLELEGLVQINVYRGATVVVLTAEQVAEIYELRILLEAYLLGLVTSKLDGALIDELEAVADELELPGEIGQRLDRRALFYELLYERAERPRALAQVITLRSSIGRYLLQRVDEQHDHGEFIGFLRAGDAQGATDWLTDHLENVSRLLQALVAAQQSEEP